MKTGLVLEGGAMRGMFTAGVLDVLMEHGITVDGAIGVSAGAVFGCNMGSIPVRVMNKIPDLRIRDFFMQPVRGIEETRRPAGRKKEPSGLFFSVWVPISRNVKKRWKPF